MAGGEGSGIYNVLPFTIMQWLLLMSGRERYALRVCTAKVSVT